MTVKRNFGQNHSEHGHFKRDVCKGVDINLPENVGIEFDIRCNKCDHVCLNRAGLKNHHRHHAPKY